MGMFDLTKRFLNCMKTTWVPMIAQVAATFLHIYWCHLFVEQKEWDIIGLGLASSITACTLLLVTMVYAHLVSEIQPALISMDFTVWFGWWEYFSLGVPTTAILCGEYWAW